MAKELPYFRWYPSDAETDTLYASMDWTELGLYHRLLNLSWLNGGIPGDIDELAQILKVNRKRLEKSWAKVGRCFQPSQSNPAVLVNRRQEEERSHAITKSERNTNAVRSRYERRTNEVQHAGAPAGSVCVSESASEKVKNFPAPPKPKSSSAPMSQRFEEFWARPYWKKLRKELAAGVWAHMVTVENEDALFQCLASYEESAEVARGAVMNPENWLSECAAGGFTATWPKARDSPTTSARARQQDNADAWSRA